MGSVGASGLKGDVMVVSKDALCEGKMNVFSNVVDGHQEEKDAKYFPWGIIKLFFVLINYHKIEIFEML